MRCFPDVRGFSLAGLGINAVFVYLLLAGPACAEDAASATAPPPAIYQDRLVKLLTPLDQVLKKASDFGHDQGDGVVLLDERVTYVEPDGRRVVVYHTIDKAITAAGVKSLAQDSFTYKKKFQHAYLVLAQTIQPDGSRIPVKNDAVFLKTPQDETDDSIYNDELELVSVYSDVKPGSITENIIVLEETSPRIPGQFSETYAWISSWPEYLQRLVVDVPKTYAARLKITNLGQDIPNPVKTDLPADRRQLTWVKLATARGSDDGTQPPSDQVGPMVWLSTLASWDAFAAWYTAPLPETANLNAGLKAQIDSWTKDVKDPAQILNILYGHVARDVRYTGFELGKSDLQPHDCLSVWQRQYGDCKDKANLLRAMLVYKGIPAWLTLLSTEHAGLVNQANPDYRQFNHCIVYTQIGGKPLFCDPTITYGVPGLLAGGESDRPVLVLKDAKADWERTPPLQAATLAFNFDLKLRPNGELAGWMNLQAGGYYGASYQETYREMTNDQLLSSLQDDARTFFPNCTLADVAPLKDAPGVGAGAAAPLDVRAYLVLTGVLNQGDSTSQLKFPGPDYFLPDTHDYKTRQTSTYVWTDDCNFTARIQLPPGWTAANLPPRFSSDSATSHFEASWSLEKDTLTARCVVTLKHSLFPSGDWQNLGDVIAALQAWASKALVLTKTAETAGNQTPPPTDAELVADLPVLPTGEGELNLIDSEFPNDGNTAARRLALGKIATLYPSDHEAIVEAAIKLGALDLSDEKWEDTINHIRPVENANRAALDASTIAWADFLIAEALTGEKKDDQALALYRAMVDNVNVNPFRRGWATSNAAELIVKKSPAAALDYAEKGLDLDSDSSPTLYAFYASTAISNHQEDRLKLRLAKLISDKPQGLEDILLKIVDAAQSLIADSHRKEGLDLLALLDSLSNPSVTGDAFAQALKKAHAGVDALAVGGKVQQEVKQLLAQFPDLAALEKKQPNFASVDDAAKALDQHLNAKEADAALGCALRLVLGYPVDSSFTNNFWNCVNYAEWQMRAAPSPSIEAFFLKLAALSDDLPHSCDAYADSKLLWAKVLARQGHHPEAAALYDSLMKEADLSDGYQGAIALQGGANCENTGDYAGALSCYHFAEKDLAHQAQGRQALLRAALIQFDNGNKNEAFRILQLLAAGVAQDKAKPEEQIADVITLAGDATGPPAYWDHWQNWWPQWRQLESEAGLDPVKGTKVIPSIDSLADLEQAIGTARDNKDVKGGFGQLRLMAYAARFYPKAALEFVGAFATAEQLLPDHANDLRKLAIAILEPLSLSGPDLQRGRILNLLVNYVDTNQDARALDLMARAWTPELADTSSITASIDRVWSIAAIRRRQDLDKVRAALEHDLKFSSDSDRAYNVEQLAGVYVALGHPSDAIKLIQAELTNPIVTADAAGPQALKALLDNIQNASGLTQQLADGVTAWLKDHQPAWWNYAEPKDVNDPRFTQFDEILKNPTDALPPAELVKTCLLAPSVPSLNPDTQAQAVGLAYRTLLSHCVTQDQANDLADSVLHLPSFPPSVKATFLYFFLIDAYEHHQSGVFAQFAQVPDYQALSDTQKDFITRLGAFLRVDRASSPALLAYAQSLARRPMDETDFALTEDTAYQLLQNGDVASAEAIYHAMAGCNVAPNSGISKPEQQLRLLKEINFTKKLKPVLDAFRAVTLAAYPPASITQPPGFAQRRELELFDDLSEDDATRFRLYLLKLHQEPVDSGFWLYFMRDTGHAAAGPALVLRLLRAGLAATDDDSTKATLVQFGHWTVDIDNPDARRQFLSLLQPYRDSVKFPQTMENIRMYDLSLALRQGHAINPLSDFAGFTSPINLAAVVRRQIDYYLGQRDLAGLKRVLDNLSADQLVSPQLVQETLPALTAAGLDDEASLARDTLQKGLYQDILAAWLKPGGQNFEQVADDLQALGSTKDVPPDFTAFVAAHPGRQRQFLAYKLTKAYVDQDWSAAETAGVLFTGQYPTYYTMYWFLGKSLAQQGKKPEAIKALTTYCQYSKDERWYPEAQALLAQLSRPGTTSN
jgi:transglutaminase-like putative cysteine protease